MNFYILDKLVKWTGLNSPFQWGILGPVTKREKRAFTFSNKQQFIRKEYNGNYKQR